MEIRSEDNAKLLGLMELMEKEEDCQQFMTPVPWEEWGLLEYPKIVKKPMDMGSVKVNLSQTEYTSIEAVLDDINLIWQNCKLFNQQGSEIYLQAENMEKIFKREASKLKEDIAQERLEDDQDNPVYKAYTPLTYEEKSELSRIVGEISKETLTLVVRLILEKCPQAIKEGNGQKSTFEIELNTMDRPTYNSAIELFSKQKAMAN